MKFDEAFEDKKLATVIYMYPLIVPVYAVRNSLIGYYAVNIEVFE